MTPQFVYYVIPIAALLSVLVTFGLLSRTSELTVMKACGISLYRTALSVVVLSLAFSAVLFALEQRLMASANRQAEMLDAQIRGRPPRTSTCSIAAGWSARDGAIYHYGILRPAAQRDARPDDLHARRGQVGARLADLRAAGRLPRRRMGRRAGLEAGFNAESAEVDDHSPGARCPLETPEYFATEPADAEMMSCRELRRYIEELAPSGFNATPLEVELQRKLAFPFVTLVMTLLAVPFGVSAGRHGALYGIGLGIVIALSYWILISAFVAIGKAGLLPPVLAGWAPNILVVGSPLTCFCAHGPERVCPTALRRDLLQGRIRSLARTPCR